jgi:hypothetical protein
MRVPIAIHGIKRAATILDDPVRVDYDYGIADYELLRASPTTKRLDTLSASLQTKAHSNISCRLAGLVTPADIPRLCYRISCASIWLKKVNRNNYCVCPQQISAKMV